MASGFYLDDFYKGAQLKSWRRVPAKTFLREVDIRSETGEEEVLGLSGSKGVLKRSEMGQRASEANSYVGYKKVAPGQLISNKMQAWNGMFGISSYEGITSPDYAVYEFTDQNDARFVEHTVRTRLYAAEFHCRSKGMGTGFLRLNPGELLSTPFWLPDRETQKAIADFLDRETARIDQLIEKKRRFVETLSANRKIAALHVLDGFGAPSMRPTAETYDTGHAADGWSVLRVKHVVSFITSGSRGWSQFIADDGELFLQSGNIGRNMEVDLATAQRIEPRTGAEAERTRLMSCDVLVCITGGRTGAVGYLPEVDEPAYVNQHICLLRARSALIKPKLLAHFLYSEIGQKQLEFFQYGLKQGLGFAQVGEVKVPVPPRNYQSQILQVLERNVDRIDRLSDRISISVDRLHEYRSALITAAVTGQIDVATWGKRGETDRRLDKIEEEMAAPRTAGQVEARA